MSLSIQVKIKSHNFITRQSNIQALGEIEFNVLPGEFLVVLGESGCGKSTLLKIIGGLIDVSAGRINIDGKKVDGVNKETGFMPQGYSLIQTQTVRKNIELGFRLQGKSVDNKQVNEVIRLVGLSAFQNARPRNLSGGMAQRAVLARTIVMRPKLLLLDEPFSALDAITRYELQKEVQNICKSNNMTSILVTHDFDEALRLADRILLLSPRPGRIYNEYINDRINDAAVGKLRDEIFSDIHLARQNSLNIKKRNEKCLVEEKF